MTSRYVDASNCPSPHSLRNKLGRVLWHAVWLIFYRPSPKILHGWRRFLLRAFGGKAGHAAHLYPSTKIWAPWNLEMGDYSCLSHDVDCYCVAPIKIGAHATVSQYSYLCAASHDFENPLMPLVTAPITIGNGAWVAADVFVGPGVTIGEGAVVGARSSVFKDVEDWTVVIGNPARFLKTRELAMAEQGIQSSQGQVHEAAEWSADASSARTHPAGTRGRGVRAPFRKSA